MLSIFQGSGVALSIFFADSQGIARDLAGPDEGFKWRVMYNEGADYSQVFPPLGWVTGDLLLDRVSVGEYVIQFSTGGAWLVGQYLIEIVAKGVRDYSWAIRFEILAADVPALHSGDHLALVRDLRDAGVASTVPDYRAAQLIVRASKQVERYCGRVFTPKKQTMRLYADANGCLWFPSPCVWLQSISVDGFNLDLSNARLYSRALRSGSGAPAFGDDDRDTSRIVLSHLKRGGGYDVVGVFGYTEPDGSDIGCTPTQITWAVCATAQTLLSYQAGSSSTIPVDRIIEEKTATQSYKLSDNPEWAMHVTAGDTEIARVLNGFRRPMQIGVV